MKLCLDCREPLIKDTNWPKGHYAKRYYRCTPCTSKKCKQYDTYKSKKTTTREWACISDKKLSSKYSNFRNDATKRNKEVTLSRDETLKLMNSDCEYCGKRDLTGYVGLDRIDSKLGYVPGNVNPCCAKCNYGKNVYSVVEYFQHCADVVDFQLSKFTQEIA